MKKAGLISYLAKQSLQIQIVRSIARKRSFAVAEFKVLYKYILIRLSVLFKANETRHATKSLFGLLC